jgi:hypothetical protein
MRTWLKWTLLVLVLAIPATAYAAYQQLSSDSCPLIDDCPCD